MATITKLKSVKFRAQVRKRGFYRNQTFNLKREAVNWASQIEAQISTTAAGCKKYSRTLEPNSFLSHQPTQSGSSHTHYNHLKILKRRHLGLVKF